MLRLISLLGLILLIALGIADAVTIKQLLGLLACYLFTAVVGILL